MQDDKSNNNDGTDTGQEVSIVTFYLSNITLFLLANFFLLLLHVVLMVFAQQQQES